MPLISTEDPEVEWNREDLCPLGSCIPLEESHINTLREIELQTVKFPMRKCSVLWDLLSKLGEGWKEGIPGGRDGSPPVGRVGGPPGWMGWIPVEEILAAGTFLRGQTMCGVADRWFICSQRMESDMRGVSWTQHCQAQNLMVMLLLFVFH